MDLSLRIDPLTHGPQPITRSGTLLDDTGRPVGSAAGCIIHTVPAGHPDGSGGGGSGGGGGGDGGGGSGGGGNDEGGSSERVVLTSASVAPGSLGSLDADTVCVDGIAQGDVELGEVLGGGAFGTVYKGVHRGDGSILAVKEVLVETGPGSSRLAQRSKYVKELRSLYKARESPHIVHFRGAYFSRHALYICMVYMDGGDLARLAGLVSPDPLPFALLEAAAFSLVSAVVFLKDASIMHRDIKPDNVLVNTRGEVRLADFGESGDLLRSRAMTQAGNSLYAAPETLSGAGSPYTVKADVWSLGMTLLELALGYHPLVQTHPGSEPASLSMFALSAAVINNDPPVLDPTDYAGGDGGDALAEFVGLALVRDPDDRAAPDELFGTSLLAPLVPNGGPGDDAIAAVAEWVTQVVSRDHDP